MPPSPRAGDRRVPRRLELAAARESRVRTSLRCRTRSSEDCAQPASGLRARGRATDSLVHAGQSRRRAAVLPGRSCLLSRVGFPTPFPPVGGGVQARPPGAEEPEGPRSPREGGREGGRGGEAGSTRRALPRRQAEAGAESRGARRKRAPWSRAGGRRGAGPREGGDAEGRGAARRGRARGVGKAGARRWRERPWSPLLLPTLLPPPTGRGSGEAPLAGPRSRPAAAAPSLRLRGARQSLHRALLRLGHGWVSVRRRSSRAGLRWPRFLSLSARPAEAGEPGAAPAARGAAPVGPDGGASGSLLGELRVAEGRPAAASPAPTGRPGAVRPFALSPGAAEGAAPGAALRAESRGKPARPPDTSSQKMVRGAGGGGGGGGARGGRPPARGVAVYRRGGASAGASLGGEASGRRVAGARAWTRLGGDLVPQPGPTRGLGVRGTGRVSGCVCCEPC